jgi:L-alanine-DL-glutamate epimerase-like enolase superfamily enzyme
MPSIQSIRVTPVSFKLREPFVTAAGRKSRTLNVQVAVLLSDGTKGVGEASSSIAMPGETQKNMERAMKELVPELREKDIRDYRALIHACWRLQPYHPTAVAALECAILDAYTRLTGQALYQFLGGKKTSVETDLTLSVGTPDKLYKNAKTAAKKGFHKLKIKLAGDTSEKDAERVLAVHRAAPKAALVADGNQGLNASQAIDFVHRLIKANVHLKFLEQPFPKHDLPLMRTFRKKCRVPLMLDETVQTPADAMRVFEAGSADGVVIKLAKSGVLGSLDIIQAARRFQKQLVIGCMEESKLGLAASVHLACGAGVFDWVDLDSVFLLEEPPRRGGFRINGARLSVAGIHSGIGM